MFLFNKKNARIYNILLKFKNLKDKEGTFIAKKSKIAINTIIGRGSRINGPAIIKGSGSTKIGNYCAIGDNLRVISSNHETTNVNLQYGLQKKIGLTPNKSKKSNVEIGNNVWIGDSVIILAGVIIGNGAIIAAGSVVTKNIEPYSIFGGVPAKLIKYRFSKDKIIEIEKSKWWDWSLNKMKKNISFFK